MADPTYVKLTPITPLGAYGDYANGTSVFTGEAAAVSPDLGNVFVASGNDLVLAYNSGGSPVTVTIGSTLNEWGRAKDIAKNVGAGELGVFGPFRHPGWTDTDGNVYLSAASADVKFLVLRL